MSKRFNRGWSLDFVQFSHKGNDMLSVVYLKAQMFLKLKFVLETKVVSNHYPFLNRGCFPATRDKFTDHFYRTNLGADQLHSTKQLSKNMRICQRADNASRKHNCVRENVHVSDKPLIFVPNYSWEAKKQTCFPYLCIESCWWSSASCQSKVRESPCSDFSVIPKQCISFAIVSISPICPAF